MSSNSPYVHCFCVQHKTRTQTHQIRLSRRPMIVVQKVVVFEPIRLLGEVVELQCACHVVARCSHSACSIIAIAVVFVVLGATSASWALD